MSSFLPLETLQFTDKHPLIDGQKQILKNIIEWKEEPPLVQTGRSSFIIITDDSYPFKSVKIKGCGYFDIKNKKSVKPSTTEGYEAHLQNAPDGIKEVHYQIEIDEKDEPFYSIPKKRPYGAQLFSKAKMEYEVNEFLLQNWKDDIKNFPFYFPVGHGKYKDLKYKDEPLGVTLLGMPMQSEKHLGAYFEGKFEEKGLRVNPYLISYWQKHLAVTGKQYPDYFDLLSTLKVLCKKFGQGLSYLHEHFVDFDSHLFNASVDNESGNVLLFDFDHIFKTNEISDQKYFYLMLKDFEIGLVAVLSNLLLSGLAEGFVLFKELHESIDGYNIAEAFFEGYFGELSSEEREKVKYLWHKICLFVINELLLAPKNRHIHLAYDFCEKERNRSYIEIYPLMKEKIIKARPEFKLSKEKHEDIIKRFLEKRKALQRLHSM